MPRPSDEELDGIDQRRNERLNDSYKTSKTTRALAWEAIRNGCAPEYVAMRYGFSVETMKEAKDKLDEREHTAPPRKS